MIHWERSRVLPASPDVFVSVEVIVMCPDLLHVRYDDDLTFVVS
jgi:hypothetical protein